MKSRKGTGALALLCLLSGASSAAADTDTGKQNRGKENPDRLVINFVGDIAYPNEWGGIKQVDEHKHELFELVQPILDSGDLNAANIECPLTDTQTVVEKRFPIRCKPERLSYFLDAGFNLLCLANNHSLDAGKQGLVDTIDNLRKARTKKRPLWWSGTGADAEAARIPARFEPPGKNVRVTFFGVGNTGQNSKIASLHHKTLTERVAEAAKKSDVVIVSVHYGPEYHHKPYASTVKRYHELIDAGATIIHGHHAHSVQGVERYKQGLIFYNFGNFSFGSRTKRHFETGARLYSMIGRVTFEKGEIVRAELVPLYANNSYKWVLGDETIEPRHAMPQLLAGAFAKYALDEFDDFAAQVPGGQKTTLIRVGDRSFVDLGRGGFSKKQRAALIRQQKREYEAVVAAGAAPRPATAGEKRWKNRAGTPWPPPPYVDKGAKKKKAKKKAKKKPRKKRGR